MPHNNRMSSSAALTTSAIWKNVIKYDPYAGSEEQGGAAAAAEEAAMLEQQQGLMDVVKIKARETLGAEQRGACRKCGNVGHLTYQCRNHLGGLNRALGDSESDSSSGSESDDAAARARAMAAAAAGSAEGGDGGRKKRGRDEGSGASSGGSGSDGSESDSTTSSEEAARRRRRKEKKRRKKEEKKHHKKKVRGVGGDGVVWFWEGVCAVFFNFVRWGNYLIPRLSSDSQLRLIYPHKCHTGQEEAQEETQEVKDQQQSPWRAMCVQ